MINNKQLLISLSVILASVVIGSVAYEYNTNENKFIRFFNDTELQKIIEKDKIVEEVIKEKERIPNLTKKLYEKLDEGNKSNFYLKKDWYDNESNISLGLIVKDKDNLDTKDVVVITYKVNENGLVKSCQTNNPIIEKTNLKEICIFKSK